MTYFEQFHQQYYPELPAHEANKILNALENELFTALPWALNLPVEQQNQLVMLYIKQKTPIH